MRSECVVRTIQLFRIISAAQVASLADIMERYERLLQTKRIYLESWDVLYHNKLEVTLTIFDEELTRSRLSWEWKLGQWITDVVLHQDWDRHPWPVIADRMLDLAIGPRPK